MEFWEGAILVVGGIWLVGRMSRQSASHPANIIPAVMTQTPTDQNQVSVADTPQLVVADAGPRIVPGTTHLIPGDWSESFATNTAGDTSLVAGESLAPSDPPIPTTSILTSVDSIKPLNWAQKLGSAMKGNKTT
jgi:hypothetical protein